ncbi:MAG: hypothetical protein IT323_21540 [Anaerolineae bacterium]|nr:hypothetical protein [Anaerolineae bacterium]
MFWIGVLLAAVAGGAALIWFGGKTKPRPFPPFVQETLLDEWTTLPAGLPAPVERYFRAVFRGERAPVIRTAVVTGRAKLRIKGVPLEGRFRFIHEAGQHYRHYLEATLFGRPIMQVNERYIDGQTRFELPWGVEEHSAKAAQAANLGLWSESIWLPSIFFTDPRVRWEGIDATHARLIVPFEGGDDSFTVTFDADSGLLTRLESLRYRDATEQAEKILWRNDIEGWIDAHGVRTPKTGIVHWMDQKLPWAIFTVDEIAYNVDLSTTLRAKGL